MALFETLDIHSIENGHVRQRVGKIMLDQDHIANHVDAYRPLMVTGLQRKDFEVTAVIIDAEGTTRINYFKTQHQGNRSVLIPQELLDEECEAYATPELASKLFSVDDQDLWRFALDSVLIQLDELFPAKFPK